MTITGIQLIDYYLPTFHNVFKTTQTLKRGGVTLRLFQDKVPLTFLDIIGSINHGISGLNVHQLGRNVHISNSSGSALDFSDELRKALNVCNLLPYGVNYCVSETQNDYHVSLKGFNLGIVTIDDKTGPSNDLATLPSCSMNFPLFTFEPKLVNYLDIEITTHEGMDVNFHDKPYRLILKIID